MLCGDLEGWDGMEWDGMKRWRAVQEEGDICIHITDSVCCIAVCLTL